MKRRYEKLIDNLSKNLKDIEVKQAHCFSVIESTDDQKLISEVIEDMLASSQRTDERIFNEAIYKKLLINPNLSKRNINQIIIRASNHDLDNATSNLYSIIASMLYIRKLTFSQLWEILSISELNRPTIYPELIECDDYLAFLDRYFEIEKERLMEKRNNREEMKKKYCI